MYKLYGSAIRAQMVWLVISLTCGYAGVRMRSSDTCTQAKPAVASYLRHPTLKSESPIAVGATDLKIDWGVFTRYYFDVTRVRWEDKDIPDGTGQPVTVKCLVFNVEAKATFNAFNSLPLFKAEFLDNEGIAVSSLTFVTFDPRPINWDAGTRSRAYVILPDAESLSRVATIKISRAT